MSPLQQTSIVAEKPPRTNFSARGGARAPLIVDPQCAPAEQIITHLPGWMIQQIAQAGCVVEEPHSVLLRNSGNSGHPGATYLQKLELKHPEVLVENGAALVAAIEMPHYLRFQHQTYSVELIRKSCLTVISRSEPLHLFAVVKLLRRSTPHVLVTAYGINEKVLRKRLASDNFSEVGSN